MSQSAYKILTGPQWASFQQEGRFLGTPVDMADGYIHMSSAEQLEETLAKHFAGQQGLVVAEIDVSRFGDAVKWEVSRGGALFPHLYAPLLLDAVIGTMDRNIGA